MTYNINKAKGWNFFQEKLIDLENTIVKNDADIVLLQEVVGLSTNRKILEAQFEKLADSIWSEYRYAKNCAYKNGHHGNAILSRYPIKDFYQEDISTNRLERRGVLYTKINIFEDRSIHIYNLHLDLTQRGRRKQILKIKEMLKSHTPRDQIIIAGDFNDWNVEINLSFEKMGFKEAGKVTSGHSFKTFPSLLPLLRLDRVYFKNLNLVDSLVLSGNKFSDHLPIVCEFYFN